MSADPPVAGPPVSGAAGWPEPAAPAVPSGLRKVLLRLPNWLGDVVLSAPAVAAIRDATPGAERVAEVRAPFVPLAALLPGVDRAVARPRGGGTSRADAEALRYEGYDAAVVFPRSFRAAVGPWRARIPVRVGLASGGRGPLLTHRIAGWRPWRAAHRTAYYGLLARPFRVAPPADWSFAAPPAHLAAGDRVLAGLGRRPGRPLVVLEAGAAYGPAKCWAPDRFGALARGLVEARDADVATIGAAEGAATEEQVARVAGRRLLRAVGRTGDLAALIGLLARADLVVSNDTGPMHVAAALGRPVLALFGASDPTVSAPAGPGPRVVFWRPAPCSPCFLRRCPVPGHPCLDGIGVEAVLREALRLLDGRG